MARERHCFCAPRSSIINTHVLLQSWVLAPIVLVKETPTALSDRHLSSHLWINFLPGISSSKCSGRCSASPASSSLAPIGDRSLTRQSSMIALWIRIRPGRIGCLRLWFELRSPMTPLPNVPPSATGRLEPGSEIPKSRAKRFRTAREHRFQRCTRKKWTGEWKFEIQNRTRIFFGVQKDLAHPRPWGALPSCAIFHLA